jgi:pimeloyl-ACP methyl ester carboxylesterase
VGTAAVRAAVTPLSPHAGDTREPLHSAADALDNLNRDNFKRGIHWQFVDDPASDLIWISFSTASRAPGSFNNFRSLQALPGKRLFLGDPENHYYQKRTHDIIDLIKQVRDRTGVQRAIYWGSSMGAYAAVLFGALDLLPATTYAFAPQLCLTHLNTHAAHYITNPTVLDETYKDIRPILSRRGLHGINALVPCYHAWDGIQVQDFKDLGPKGATGVRFVGSSHRVLEEIIATEKQDILSQYFQAALRGESIEVPAAMRPSDLDIGLGILSHRCVEYVAGRTARPNIDIDDSSSRNYGWFNAKLRMHHFEGNFDAAIAAGLRSLSLAPDSAENLICLGNTYTASPHAYGPMLGEALYRQAWRLNPKHAVARTLLANNLRRRGLLAEATAVEASA